MRPRAEGLCAVAELARRGALDGYLYLYATRADLLRRLGRSDDAREAVPRARPGLRGHAPYG